MINNHIKYITREQYLVLDKEYKKKAVPSDWTMKDIINSVKNDFTIDRNGYTVLKYAIKQKIDGVFKWYLFNYSDYEIERRTIESGIKSTGKSIIRGFKNWNAGSKAKTAASQARTKQDNFKASIIDKN